MDGFVDRLHALRFLRACDPSYGALTFTLVGLPPTGYISLLLDILFGSFLPSLWSSTTTVYSGRGSRHCYAIMWFLADSTCPVSALTRTLASLTTQSRRQCRENKSIPVIKQSSHFKSFAI